MLRGAEYLRRHARRLFLGLDGERTGPEERVRLSADLLAGSVEAGRDVTGTLEGLEATLQLLVPAAAGRSATRLPATPSTSCCRSSAAPRELREDLPLPPARL